MKQALMNAVRIMLLVVAISLVLFLICGDGGRVVMMYNFFLAPFIWVFTFPVIGPVLFIIAVLVVYAVLMKSPSPKWKKNEKHVFWLLLFITAGGFLSSTEHAGVMFLLTCLVGVSYPIIQIIRFEIKNITSIMKILS